MLKKNSFSWSSKVMVAFQDLKVRLVSAFFFSLLNFPKNLLSRWMLQVQVLGLCFNVRTSLYNLISCALNLQQQSYLLMKKNC